MNPSPVNLRAVAGPLLVAGATTALVFGAGLVSGRTLFRDGRPTSAVPATAALPAALASTEPPAAAPTAPAPAPDSCGLPAGILFDSLAPADRSFALRRAFLCSDLQAGRLSSDEYRSRLALLEAASPRLDLATPPDPDEEVVWASSVRAFSSQYTDSDWSAARALGPPDVPAGGDDPGAWASEGADDRVEFLEVGLATPRRIHGIDVVENYNPGAITGIELIAADGTRTTAYSARPAASATSPFHRHIDIACTAKPIAALRLTLDSTAVPDWNEIDAIGVRPCP